MSAWNGEIEEQVVKYRIVRRDSKYNKYIKWFAETLREDGSAASSFGFKTEREARQSIVGGNPVFAIGNRRIRYAYQEVSA